jgi:undecaprenyl-diphosphatase
MKKKNLKSLYASIFMLWAFVLWTIAVRFIDVRAIGPDGSSVGFATVNAFFHKLTGVHMSLYYITDWLGLVPIAFCVFFAVWGLCQLISRKSLRRVDFSLLALGLFYIVVIACYLLFEEVVINYRPVLIEGVLEASYPSSTTLLTLCVMSTAIIQLFARIKPHPLKWGVTLLLGTFTLFMVIGRLLTGVHWFSDIVGGLLLSAGLVLCYLWVCGFNKKERED